MPKEVVLVSSVIAIYWVSNFKVKALIAGLFQDFLVINQGYKWKGTGEVPFNKDI